MGVGVQEVELLAPKNRHNKPNIAFEVIIDIGCEKVDFFHWPRLNLFLACCPIVSFALFHPTFTTTSRVDAPIF
jgi:hypothetical protein